jgi:hypothetical protein
MAALDFPVGPTPGQRYPDPAIPGVTQYEWDNTVGVWNTVANFVRLNNQNAFNGYVWPLADGLAGQQLETDGAGNLYWDNASDPTFYYLALDGSVPFDGVQTSFTLIDPATTNAYTPDPISNIEVFLGGVPQEYGTAYTIAGSTINFTNPPVAGTSFFATTVIQGP